MDQRFLIDISSISQFPLYFGTAIYAFEGIGVVLPLENQMKTPKDMKGWNGVLNTAMTMVACLYIAVGFFGYLKYGEVKKNWQTSDNVYCLRLICVFELNQLTTIRMCWAASHSTSPVTSCKL